MIRRTDRPAPGNTPGEERGTPFEEWLAGKVEGVETLLAELIDRKLPSVEDSLEELRELVASRRKDHFVVEEFAEMVGRTPYTIRRWIAEGKLQAIRLQDGGPRGRFLIPRSELERVIASGKGAQVPDSAIR